MRKEYGMLGWKEFRRNRKDILDEFDRAKEYNRSRPVRTEHGNAGEAPRLVEFASISANPGSGLKLPVTFRERA